MDSSITLHYFDAKGRGEVIRWILHAAGKDFTDDRINHGEWMQNPKLKEKTPFGTLPYVEVNGKVLGQSHAIARHFAKQYGFAGKGDWEEAEVDALVDYTEDIYKGWVKWLLAMMSHDHKAEELKKQHLTVDTVPYLNRYASILRQQKQEKNSVYLVGTGPTWADFTVVDYLDQLVELDKSILDPYSELKDLADRIHGLRGIKEWLSARPYRPF